MNDITKIKEYINSLPKENKKQLHLFLRLALTGQTSGPDIFKIMEILGEDVCKDRIQNFLNYIEVKIIGL